MFQLKLKRLQLIMLYVFRSTMSKHLRRLLYLYLISKIKIQERHSVQFETFFSFFPFLNLDRTDFSCQQLLAINKRCLDGKKTFKDFQGSCYQKFSFLSLLPPHSLSLIIATTFSSWQHCPPTICAAISSSFTSLFSFISSSFPPPRFLFSL